MSVDEIEMMPPPSKVNMVGTNTIYNNKNGAVDIQDAAMNVDIHTNETKINIVDTTKISDRL